MVDASIAVLDRGRLELDLNTLVEGNTVGNQDEPNPDTDFIEIPVYNLVIDHPEATILWDTGTHHEALDGHWPDEMWKAFCPYDVRDHHLEDDLGKAGYGLEDIDAVFQSHLHVDHSGGLPLFEGTDVPIYAHEEEIKFAFFSANTDEGSSAYLPADFGGDLNWQVLHRQREEHFKDVEFIHLPGHTPGLTGTMIHLDDEGTVIFANDEAYRTENYVNEQPLGAGLMWSHRHWYDSLYLLKELERRHDAEVVYGHDLEQFQEFKSGW